MPQNLSCIIPAHNEGPRIGAVLQAVVGHPLLAEVIVVDDGSQDETCDVVARFGGVRLLRQPRNKGKAAAIAAGVAAARGDLLMLLDSDLTGLTPGAVSRLARPVVDGHADAAISLRGNAPLPWRMIGLDYISGERVMPRALLPASATLQTLPGFGLEAAMNAHWLATGAHIAVVPWPDVASPAKAAKHGTWTGVKADIGMLRDIGCTIGLGRAARQVWQMRRKAQVAPRV